MKPPSPEESTEPSVLVVQAMEAYSAIEPTSEELAGLDARMATLLATPPGAVAGASAATAKPSWLAWAGGGFALVGVAWFALSFQGSEPREDATPALATHEAAPPPEEAAPVLRSEPAPSEAPLPQRTEAIPRADAPKVTREAKAAKVRAQRRRSRIAAPPTSSETESAPEPTSCLSCELEHLEAARHAMRQRRFGLALSHAQKHREEFLDGVLTEEREAIAIRALYRLGKLEAADSRHASFRTKFPESIYTRELRIAKESSDSHHNAEGQPPLSERTR